MGLLPLACGPAGGLDTLGSAGLKTGRHPRNQRAQRGGDGVGVSFSGFRRDPKRKAAMLRFPDFETHMWHGLSPAATCLECQLIVSLRLNHVLVQREPPTKHEWDPVFTPDPTGRIIDPVPELSRLAAAPTPSQVGVPDPKWHSCFPFFLRRWPPLEGVPLVQLINCCPHVSCRESKSFQRLFLDASFKSGKP